MFRKAIYILAFLAFVYLLFKEYTYVHPYNTGYKLYPGWKYVSTCTFTWWFILIGALVLTVPLFRKQTIGFLGLCLLIGVIVRPIVQYKFPEEQASDFYKARREKLNEIINKYENDRDRIIKNDEITKLNFDQLKIYDNTYFFQLYDPDFFGQGICYDEDGCLPKEIFERPLKYKKLEGRWYEFDSF